MPELKGKLLICDRCGETHFLKYIRTDRLDGGFGDRVEYFEDRPDEWLYVTQIGTLCPKCTDEFKLMVSRFVNGKIAPGWKHKSYITEEKIDD